MYIIFSAVCVGELFLMYDFGTALIFFFTFIVIAFMRSGDVKTLILVCMVAAFGAVLILMYKPYVADRFSTYMHVWDYMDEGGYQQTRTLIYSASGGLFGLGLGSGKLRNVFAASEDLVFGVVCEEFGMIMAYIIPLTYAVIAVWAVVNADKAKSTFYTIAGVAAIGMMLFQSMLSIFGITDLLPLTGVTLPFVSKGGSSIISCFCLLAYIKSIDTRSFASFKPVKEESEK
jgi:cell division protein FtsW (lipid II flippase)